MTSRPVPPRRPADLAAATLVRRLRLGPPQNKITIQRRLPVPMRDGTVLVADHYAPVASQPGLTARPRPTVLLRCPYGRGPEFAMIARPFAEHGYHVVLQSCRGTFGSGGQFTPGTDEAADGQDTVAWLRTRDWFSGKLAVVGLSYLAFTAWALLTEPPPELTAVAVYISPHDLAAAGFGQGPFELYNLLMWSDLMASQERVSPLLLGWRVFYGDRRLIRMASRLPIAATGSRLASGAPWYADWLDHQDRLDPYYSGYSAAAALEKVTAPTLLIGGFHDFFAEQTVHQFQTLRRRDVPVQLIMGPWTHMTLDMSLAARETLAWLDAYADGNAAAAPPQPYPVRAFETGADRWLGMADWPPASATPAGLYLRAGGRLAGSPPDPGLNGSGPGASSFRYDPADPTPSVGGRLMSMRHGGSQDNSAVERRPDVLTFTTEPLDGPVEVVGVPVVRLHVSSDNQHFDLFARLCDVGPDGRSRNITDQIIRSVPGHVTLGTVHEVEIRLTSVAHVFLPGHRIRLQLSGGAHPRFARNLGTGDDLVHGIETAPVTHHVRHSAQYPSALLLPVLGRARQAPAGRAEQVRAAEQAREPEAAVPQPTPAALARAAWALFVRQARQAAAVMTAGGSRQPVPGSGERPPLRG